MEAADIKKYIWRARYVAKTSGYPQLAEDFTQFVFLQFAEKPDRHATVDQLFVDYLRETFGSSRSSGGLARQRATARAIDIHERANEGEISRQYSYDGRSAFDHTVLRGPDLRFEDFFNERQAFAFRKWAVEEFTMREICEMMGVTESRVSQIVLGVQIKVQHKWSQSEFQARFESAFANELKLYKQQIEIERYFRERLIRAWDIPFGSVGIDWITI